METELIKEEQSFMLKVRSLAVPLHRNFFIAQATIRVLAFALTLAASCVMVTSKQTISLFGIQFGARYYYSSAFKFLLGADIITCALSVLSLILLNVHRRRKLDPGAYFLVFLHDMLVAMLMVAGCAAATAIGYVGRYGQEHSGWVALCDRVEKFCNRILISVVLSYLAFLCFFLLTLLSAHKLKSRVTD